MKHITIFNLCIINFLLAISSTIGMTIIPILVVDHLGLSFFILGFIEGLSEFFASTIRLYSGIFFDKKENKLQLLLYPIYLAFISKLILLHPNTFIVILTKFLERLSNGAFAPLRDAIILKLATQEGKDLSFINISKSAGCIIGPFIVLIASPNKTPTNINLLIIFCIVICFIAILLGIYLKRLPLNIRKIKTESITFNLKDIKALKPIYPILILSCLFFLCRFNDGVIFFYLRECGYPDWVYINFIGIFNFFMLISAPFLGQLLDKGKVLPCINITIFSMILFNILSLGLREINIGLALITLFFWGIQRVSSQMTFLFLIKQIVNPKYLGRAIGLYSLLTGISVLIAATTCGFLAKISFTYIFIYSLICALLCLIFLKSFQSNIVVNE